MFRNLPVTIPIFFFYFFAHRVGRSKFFKKLQAKPTNLLNDYQRTSFITDIAVSLLAGTIESGR